MRTINQIQIAVQEADPDIADEELRLCIEAQRNIEHFLRSSLIDLITWIREGRPEPLLKMKAEFAWGTVERMFNASKKPPAEWLGESNIPGSPGQRQRLAFGKRLIEKVTGEKLG
jgi:hypothetical protein